ncbi:ribosomal l9 rnase h1 [Pyrenophora seminiperda CCB06]|uniref:Ribosomal l9 rnase h1 n=1 Tax=Pyrenophora seminiperda CCB06 TaxID=1302712 RepID=A0A3M7MB04_9PLEO|nr:ribosomal l9 rnase h1 [Pyrenophora seminiperda CCB06]
MRSIVRSLPSMRYRAGRHLSFAREAGKGMPSPATGAFRLRRKDPELLYVDTFLDLDDGTSYHDTPNGFNKGLSAAPAVHIMVTRQNFDVWGPQQTRNISKKAKEAERNIIVKLLKDVPRYGRAGSYVPLNPSLMRNRWFPARIADYVPAPQLKQLKAQDADMARDPSFGIRANLEEVEEDDDDDSMWQQRHYIRPIEIAVLSPKRSMELIDTFVPPTIDFYRQRIEQESQSRPRMGSSGAADILTAIAMNKAKSNPDAIYGSVSSADLVNTIRGALAHNDEAARVILNEADVKFLSGHEEGDPSRVKQLGIFKAEIRLPGAQEALERTIRIRAKESEA